MSLASGVTINDECITAFNDFRMSRGKTKFIIFKIADNRKEIVIDETSQNPDYEAFRSKLEAVKDAKGNAAPRYAVYDVEYELGGGEGKRNKIIFISWVPTDTPTFWSMLYASTREKPQKCSEYPHLDPRRRQVRYRVELYFVRGQRR